MKLSKREFGKFEDHSIDLYAMENANGLVVKVMTYGATVTSIQVPEGNKKVEIACGFDDFESYFAEAYVANAPYFGSTVGRYCSQIKDAKFSIGASSYELAKMVGDNNLHGGLKGFDKKVWTAKVGDEGLMMTLISPDGEEGFPGEVEASVAFYLSDDNELSIKYSASTTKTTPLSMTNHTYFNLSGFETNVEPFVAQVNTDKLMVMDETGAATGEIINVEGTDNDLREGKTIAEMHAAVGGLESFYIFDDAFTLKEKAKVTDPKSGRSLTVKSTEPCMLLYTGKYTSDELKRENGLQYGQYRGFCCETHRWQNGPNIPEAPKAFTQPGDTFESETIFAFDF